MTIDFKLSHACPHTAIQVPVTLADDNQTLVLPYSIGNFDPIQVFVHGTEIPSTGLWSTLSLQSFGDGPYAILPWQRDLTIQTDERTESFTLPSGSSVSVDHVLEILSGSQLVRVEHTTNLKLVPRQEAFTLSVSGGAVVPLGFIQRADRVRQTIPGWKFFVGDRGLTVQFVQPLRVSDRITLTYAFDPNRCPRCASTRVENDIRYNASGSLVTVANEDLLAQQVLKILLTNLGSNRYATWYGTNLRRRIGSKALAGTAALIQEDVNLAVRNFRDVQRKIGQVQRLTDRERLVSVDTVNVSAVPNLPTAFQVDIVLRNASNQPVQLTTIFTVPGVTAVSR